MTVGVFGLGRFGSFWSSLLAKRFDVIAYDIDPARAAPEGVSRVSIEELCASGTVFLCVSIRAVQDVLPVIAPHLPAGALVADTCSVKIHPARWMRELLPPRVSILATHPMFGPESAKDGLEGLPIMLDPVRLDAERTRFWEESFASFGLVPVRMDCDRHDREAAYSQALTHFVGRSLHRMGLPETEIATRWYRKLHAVAKQCVRDAPELFEDMQRYNPYAAAMRGAVMAAFASTLSDLGEDIYAVSLDAAFRSPVESDGMDLTGQSGGPR
jgi:prephenate dehydrogenase